MFYILIIIFILSFFNIYNKQSKIFYNSAWVILDCLILSFCITFISFILITVIAFLDKSNNDYIYNEKDFVHLSDNHIYSENNYLKSKINKKKLIISENNYKKYIINKKNYLIDKNISNIEIKFIKANINKFVIVSRKNLNWYFNINLEFLDHYIIYYK